MKIVHKPEIDFVSIDFKEGIEAKAVFENGVIVRTDKKGNVIGIDITNSRDFFGGGDDLTMQEACELLGISESTMRRRIRDGKIPFTKPNGKDYRFKRSDILKAS